MDKRIDIIKGLHPGFFLEHELNKRNLGKVKFAESLGEHPQTIVAIMKGRRRMNPALSLKIEEKLGLEEGFLMQMQVFYDIDQIKKQQAKKIQPDISKFRDVVFWDTDIKKIDWANQKTSVIKRICERGNEQELVEIIRFYGDRDVSKTLQHSNNLTKTKKEKIKAYLSR